MIQNTTWDPFAVLTSMVGCLGVLGDVVITQAAITTARRPGLWLTRAPTRTHARDDGIMTAGDAHERPKKAEIFPEERGGVECGDRGFELAGMADLPRRG